MKIKAQMGMVMNLDKCIGCHTCSVTCKNTWTNREGTEYMWWNNVETRPGVGYPKEWENQEKYRGGWHLKNGKLELRAGGRLSKLANIFWNPDLPQIDDYYEPWTYDYENLILSPEKEHQPVARPKSQLTGDYMDITWGPNWEDDLAGVHETGKRDPNMKGLENKMLAEYDKAFMMYLPRICEHCINPSCVSSCPSGAMYKRDEDGIVLVSQPDCRAWRFCVSGCPYKKVYFNWKTNKAEKCHFCYPRIEAGLPTVCSETCVGRIRYIGIVLYDAERVGDAAAVKDEKDLYESQLSIILDPHDPEIIRQAKIDGIADDWIEAAQRSPIYKLLKVYKVALPLHPEYRTLPMVWYVPPLSPMLHVFGGEVTSTDPDVVFPTINQFRIPIEYLANLLTAGDTKVVETVLQKLVAMRSYMRQIHLKVEKPDTSMLKAVGLTEELTRDLYDLSAIAKYSDRYVIPLSHKEYGGNMHKGQGAAGYEHQETYTANCSVGEERDMYYFDEGYWKDLNGNA